MSDAYLFTSESVTEGHPDKVADGISDCVLDANMARDRTCRVACEVLVSTGMVVIAGEITSKATLNYADIARDKIRRIGYVDPILGFAADTCTVLVALDRQSPDISQGVDAGGAGDQGIMYGYATDETKELMPLPITLAHALVKRVEEVRKKKILDYLGPDCKSQVTVEYVDGEPVRIDTVVLAAQHTEKILDKTGMKITDKARQEIIKVVAMPIVGKLIDKNTKFYINQTGKFVVGGPQSDTGVTGRKIIVDTYGGIVPHGGGAFSGKDPTKVDRSAAYMARYITKNIVAAGIAKKCLIQLSYVIGKAEPLSIFVDTMGTGKISEEKIVALIRKNFDLTPAGIIKKLELRKYT